MRNLISLSVYFLLVVCCDVLKTTNNISINIKINDSRTIFKMMKLITLSFSIFIINKVSCQRYQDERFPFPPQFQTPNSQMFLSSSPLFLPPEAHTAMPYFAMKNMNNLKFPLLPPTGTKVPPLQPSPFPFLFSTTIIPSFDNEEDDNREGNIKLRPTLPKQQPYPPKNNVTDKMPNVQKAERRELRTLPKMFDYQNPIDRIDIKFPTPMSKNNSGQSSQTVSPPELRKVIIPQDRNDRTIDQVKAGSFPGSQFLTPNVGNIFISPTTEPAIPIIRLSNEMDLDGSFSYEALGADQTHYVQHSRMENMGTDKEEQVVEGSYSYVGDNGQTYTVHYVADANGYRAVGEHLPVAPPVPEIIQRAVQYNLAEEAKKPPHLRVWQEDDSRHENLSNEGNHHSFTLPSPTRNLFTGKTPEAFSFNFGQGTDTQNNLLGSSSNQVQVKALPEFKPDQSMPKPNASISPQITFLASQGAHVPNIAQQKALPQLLNYEANLKEQNENDNKQLWRWQYGLNAEEANQNQSPEKNTISRSFGEGDDVIINFSDMTPDQYTNMIRSLEPGADKYTSAASYQQPQNGLRPIEASNDNFKNLHTESTSITYKAEDHSDLKASQMNPEKVSYNAKNLDNKLKSFEQQSLPAPQLTSIKPIFFQPLDKQIQNNPTKQEQQQQVQQQQQLESQIQQQKYQVQQQIQQEQLKELTHRQQYQLQQQQKQQNTIDTQQKSMQSPPDRNQLPRHVQSPESIKSTHHNVDNVKSEFNFDMINHPRKLSADQNDLHKPKKSVLDAYDDYNQYSNTEALENDYQDSFYEPRRILKAINPYKKDNSQNVFHSNINKVQNDTKSSEVSPQYYFSTLTNSKFTDVMINRDRKNNTVTSTSTTPEPTSQSYLSSTKKFKLFDFIVKDNLDPNPTTTEPITSIAITTEGAIENIFENNIFLKNFVRKDIKKEETEPRQNNEETEESLKPIHTNFKPVTAEPKVEKVPKVVHYQSSLNELKSSKKPLDIAELFNYITLKSHFEPGKMKPKSSILNLSNSSPKNEVKFIPSPKIEIEHKENKSGQDSKLRTFTPLQQEELKGIIKNYKVLHRRQNNMSNQDDGDYIRRDLTPPKKQANLPPLGRAGPSMKSYLPPIYVKK